MRLTSSSDEDLSSGLLGLGDESGDLVERGLVDDRSHEVGPVLARPNLDLLDLALHLLPPSSLPQALGHVHPSERGALLSRVLEPGSDRLDHGLLDVGRLVDQVEVLSAGLSDDTRVGSVEVDVVGDLLPESLEDGGRTGEVETGELLVVDTLLDDLGCVSRDELEDRTGDTCLEEELVGQVVGVGRHRGRLPQAGVSDNDGCADEVSSNGGEVERSHSEHESLERSELSSAE